jgi:DNA-binding IscR family transcriptional regulator
LSPPASITLDLVLRAVGGCANLGCPPPGAKGCPVGERIPVAIRAAIESADSATAESLSKITVADLLKPE